MPPSILCLRFADSEGGHVMSAWLTIQLLTGVWTVYDLHWLCRN